MNFKEFPQDKTLLNDKVILVTGAGDGIGRQAAITFAEYGAEVILLGKTVSKLESVYDEIVENDGKQPAIVPLDMNGATVKNYKDMAQTILDQFGRLDGLLNNASIFNCLNPIDHINEESFDKVMRVNFKATFFLTQALIPVLKQSASPSVLFTSSSVGKQSKAFWGEYAFSKFATEGLMQTMAEEFGHTGMKINAINPGATKTRMRAKAYPGEDATLLKTPLDLMPTYLYLISNQSDGVNGQSIDAQPKV